MFVRSTSQALYGTARNGCGAVQAEFPPLPLQRRPVGAKFGTCLQALYTRTNYILRTTLPTTGHGSPAQDMEMAHYRALLAMVGRKLCVSVTLIRVT